MNPFIQEIIQYLDDKSTIFFIGDNIFIGEMPVNTFGLSVQHGGGNQDKYTGIEIYSISFYAIHNNSKEAFDYIQEVKEMFHRKHHYDTDNWYIHESHGIGNILDLIRDGEGRKVLRYTVSFTVHNKNLIS